jgi:hypothetical protein
VRLMGDLLTWGKEVLQDEDGTCAWVCKEEGLTREQAKHLVAKEWGCEYMLLRCQAVWMGEETEVEAKINAHEFPYLVECTPRRRGAQEFWRIWREDEPPMFIEAQRRAA